MIKININSVEFNYKENEEIENVTIHYRGRTDDYKHNVNGSLDIEKVAYDLVEFSPQDLVKVVQDFLIENIKQTDAED